MDNGLVSIYVTVSIDVVCRGCYPGVVLLLPTVNNQTISNQGSRISASTKEPAEHQWPDIPPCPSSITPLTARPVDSCLRGSRPLNIVNG